MECEGVEDYVVGKDYSYLLCPKCGMCKCHACTCCKGSASGTKLPTRPDDVSHGDDFRSGGDHPLL